MELLEAVEKKFSEKLKEIAKENGVPYRDVQLLIFTNKASGKIEFNIYIKQVFLKKLRLQEDILEIKIDFLGAATKVNIFLNFMFGGYAEELKCEKEEISVLVVARSNEDASACLALQKSNEFQRWIDLRKELSGGDEVAEQEEQKQQ